VQYGQQSIWGLEAVYDNGGKVLSFAARFEQHCDGEDPGLRGKIFYQAEFPFCHSTLQPDFNGDCIFNLIDLAHLSALWLINYEQEPLLSACEPEDFDQDGSDYLADCDDTSPAVHPGMTEIFGNGIDDDCNGQADDGC